MTVKEILEIKDAKYFKHPNSHKQCYVEVVRDDKGKGTHFITHHEKVSHMERIDDRSYYDKQEDSRWVVLTQTQVDEIVKTKEVNNVTISVTQSNVPVLEQVPVKVKMMEVL